MMSFHVAFISVTFSPSKIEKKNVLFDFCFYQFLQEVHQLLLSELGRGSRRGSYSFCLWI